MITIPQASLKSFLKAIKPNQSLQLDQLHLSYQEGFIYLSHNSRVSQVFLPVVGDLPDRSPVSFPLSGFLGAVKASKKGNNIKISVAGDMVLVQGLGFSISLPRIRLESYPLAMPDLGDVPSYSVRPFWPSYMGKVVERDSPRNYGTVALFENGFSKVVGTNGFRLAVSDSGLRSDIKNNVTLGHGSFLSLSEVMQQSEATFQVSEDETSLKVSGIHMTAFYRLSSVKYPNYHGILPDLLKYRPMEIERKALLDQLTAAINFTDKTKAIKIETSDKGMLLIAGSNVFEVPVSTGEIFTAITFNGKYLIEALSATKDKMVRIYFKGEDDPITIVTGNTKTILCPIIQDK